MIGWFIRMFVAEAARAGFHDAISGGDGTGLTHQQASQAFLKMVAASGLPPPVNGSAPEPPQLSSPDPTDTAALADQPKRGPGRPRKFQEPPE